MFVGGVVLGRREDGVGAVLAAAATVVVALGGLYFWKRLVLHLVILLLLFSFSIFNSFYFCSVSMIRKVGNPQRRED